MPTNNKLPLGGDLCRILQANFYEKAHFVKADVAAAMWRERQLLSALRAMLLFALR